MTIWINDNEIWWPVTGINVVYKLKGLTRGSVHRLGAVKTAMFSTMTSGPSVTVFVHHNYNWRRRTDISSIKYFDRVKTRVVMNVINSINSNNIWRFSKHRIICRHTGNASH